MIKNIGKNKLLWLLSALLALTASLVGVLDQSIYSNVISREVLPGTISQDMLTIAASIVLLYLAARTKDEDSKKQIVALGILGYLFYAYGIYSIERVYNSLYFLYLAIFSLSFYSIVYGAANIRQEALRKAALPDRMRKIAVGFSLVIAVLFSALWIVMLIPLIQEGRKIEFTYSIFIIDLAFIMPAFVILAVMAARKQGLGLLLTPALYVLGFTLLLPVGLGELLKPFYDLPIDTGGLVLYLSISTLFLIVALFYLRELKIHGKAA